MQTFNPRLWEIAGGAPATLDTPPSEPSNWCDPNVIFKNSIKTTRPRRKLSDLVVSQADFLRNNLGYVESLPRYERDEFVAIGQILPVNLLPNDTHLSHEPSNLNNLSGDYDSKDERRNDSTPPECFDDEENVLYDVDYVKYAANPFIDETCPFEISCGYKRGCFEMHRDGYSNVSTGRKCGRNVSGSEDTFAAPGDGSERWKCGRHLDWRPPSNDNGTWLSIPNL